MDLSLLLQTIVAIAVLIGIGMFIGYKIPLSVDIRRLLPFIIINIVLPALILNGFFQLSIDKEMMQQISTLFFFSLGFHGFSLVITLLVGKSFMCTPQKVREIAFLSTFGNTGLIGIPLCAALFGPQGAVFAAVFEAGMCLTLWTVGVMLIEGHKKITVSKLKKALTMPVVAVLTGLVITLFEFSLPIIVQDIIGTLADAATPVAMFYIGMLVITLIQTKITVPYQQIALPVVMKLVILPILGIIFLIFFPLHEQIVPIILISMAMPTITTAPIMMAFYKADENFGVMTTISSIVFSLISIYLIFYIGNYIL